MKNTKLQALIMAGAMAASSLSAMSVFADETTSEAATEEVSAAEVDTEGKFVLEYPEDMQELGYTDPIVLDEVPERVVSLSAAPVLALYELGVNLVGIPNSMVVTWPEDLKESTETVSFSVMSPDDFDYESVVDLEPDLVLLAYNGADTAEHCAHNHILSYLPEAHNKGRCSRRGEGLKSITKLKKGAWGRSFLCTV